MTRAPDLAAATAYSQAHAPHALLVARGEEIVAHEYGVGWTAQTPHALYSGTKSFWGPVAICAQEDGLLDLDERVAETIASWCDDPWKGRVTLRMLLSLTAGFGFGGLGAGIPSFERAAAAALKTEPGSRFAYGGIALQVFGAVLSRKLAAREQSPQAYLRERVLDPAGVTIAAWRRPSGGAEPLPTGAALSAGNWLQYGRFIARERSRFADCWHGSDANPRYGLGWWLGAPGAPADLVYGSGAGGQALYLVPSLRLTIVRFGASASYRHDAFLRRLFA